MINIKLLASPQHELQKFIATSPLFDDRLKNALKNQTISTEDLIRVLKELRKDPELHDENSISNQLWYSLLMALGEDDLKNTALKEQLQLLTFLQIEKKNAQDWHDAYETELQKFTAKVFNGNNAQGALKTIQKELQDLKNTIYPPIISPTQKPEEEQCKELKQYGIYFLLLFIALVGLIKGASDGFGGIAALTAMIPGLAGSLGGYLLWGGFAILSVVVYVSFDYRSIAKAMGASFLDARGTLKNCYMECKQITAICEEIATLMRQNNRNNQDKTALIASETLDQIYAYHVIIQQQLENIRNKKEELVKQTQGSYARIIGQIVVAFFGSTFFLLVGFACAHSFLTGFFSLAPIDPITISISAITGLGFFASYLLLEKIGFFNLIDIILGTSEKVIHKIDKAIKKVTLQQDLLKDTFEMAAQKLEQPFPRPLFAPISNQQNVIDVSNSGSNDNDRSVEMTTYQKPF